MHSSRLIQLISSGRRTHERRQPPATDSGSAYSGLHLYEEIVLGFPLPLRERDRVRGKGAATSLLIQTKNALGHTQNTRVRLLHGGAAINDFSSGDPHQGYDERLGIRHPWANAFVSRTR